MQDLDKGLTSGEARKRLQKYGDNVLPERPPPSNLRIFLSQLKSPLVYILIVAGVVTLILGEIPDTLIITFAVLINTVLGFIQERKAGRALYALKKLIHPKANVIRDGEEVQIDARKVVPGDLIVLRQGDKVPADGKVVEASRFFVDEAILTGESIPVEKEELRKKEKKGNSNTRVYMGTIVSAGNASVVAETTGKETEIGKIALSVQEPSEVTPLKKQLKLFSKQLTFLVIVLVVFVFVIGLFRDVEPVELFETAVALAVSSIPEGMIVGLTVVLAIGMQRILKKKGLVRHLVSAETLGGVTTICIDKTGTLTVGKMQVTDAYGNEDDIYTQMILANDLDDPIVVAAYEWALSKIPNPKGKIRDMKKRYERLDSIPFSSDNKFFSSLNKWNKNNNMVFVNGAPDVLVDWIDNKGVDKKEIGNQIRELTGKGKRVMGLARKEVSGKKKNLKVEDVKGGLSWVGILAFSDPVRSGVEEALEKTRDAGIKLLTITGDYPSTAVAVLEQLNIEVSEERIILGKELETMSKGELAERLTGEQSVKLFARTTPQQKLKIVEALKENGEVVAMMGDGVNDAPAINRADIGIVVGEATDVAKESADLVLLDSSFATIVATIEEGRGIFDNVRKIILYLMSDSFEEIIAVIGTIIFGLPLPVTAAQILWINLVSDGFPYMALTVDSKRKGIMKHPPRSPKEKLINSWMKRLILIVSASGGLIALLLFYYFYKTTGDLVLARSISFATLGVNSLVYVFSIRTLTEPFWRENPLENAWLNLAVIVGVGLQILPFMSETLRSFFSVEALSLNQWVLIFSASLVMFIIIELMKHSFKERLKVN